MKQKKRFLGNFEARKVFRSSTRKEIVPKEIIKSEIEIRKTVEEKKMIEKDMKIIKEFIQQRKIKAEQWEESSQK